MQEAEAVEKVRATSSRADILNGHGNSSLFELRVCILNSNRHSCLYFPVKYSFFIVMMIRTLPIATYHQKNVL